MNAFDQFLADTREELAGVRWRQPVIDVADTMYVCKKWFEGHEVAFTASDLLAMTRTRPRSRAGDARRKGVRWGQLRSAEQSPSTANRAATVLS